ncbi:dual oxidase 2-like [Cylas formicarius]|uniref:dual oxidase 2-like n=1 Tax=Cylas formicarius TaxID=197179 RepID=UPI002958C3C1|nr:dual oxidase 2-like [Cylas formicarius]
MRTVLVTFWEILTLKILIFIEVVSQINNVPTLPLPSLVSRTTSSTPTTPIPIDFTKKPPLGEWNGTKRRAFGDWLLFGNWRPDGVSPTKTMDIEYEGYNGWYNNLANPRRGAVDTSLLRRWPASYEDNTYLPDYLNKPNPLELSDRLLSGSIGTVSKNGKNALFVFFGQQIVEEILDAQRPACPPEYFNIKVPKGHHFENLTGHTQMPFLRSRYDPTTGYSPNNPRQQLNEITPYIDGGLFYGTSKMWADELRTYANGTVDPDGKLASSHNGLFPEFNTRKLPMANPPSPFYHAHYIDRHETDSVERFFKLGNPRGNENAFLLTFGILWFRWHNYLAARLRTHYRDWSSEHIFNEARKWTIAIQQQIYLYEWLPVLIPGGLSDYPYKYDPAIDPQIDQFFQSAAFRFGHTLVVPGVYLRDYVSKDCSYQSAEWQLPAVRTCNIFWRGHEPILKTMDIDKLLMGMSVQLCEREDHKIVEDLRGNVFGPLEFPRRDLMALNVQRGRDHGLPDFNMARKAFGLDPYLNWEHFRTANPQLNDSIIDRLKDLYRNDINSIDVWIGGILETTDGPGQLFKTIILDQFRRIRDGDRFWFENSNNNLFTPLEIARIKSTSLYDIIMATTKMAVDDIPKFPFRAAVEGDVELVSKCKLKKIPGSGGDYYALPQLNQQLLNQTCVQGTSYDYFRGSALSFILTFVSIAVFGIGNIAVIYAAIRRKDSIRKNHESKRHDRIRQTIESSWNVKYPMFMVNEYVLPKNPLRQIVLLLKSKEKQICIQNYSGLTLRAIDLSNKTKCVVKIINIYDEPTTILQFPQNYDLVLKFDYEYLRKAFMKEFDVFVAANNKLEKELINNFNWKAAKNIIVTKQDRQNFLEMFFRVAFAQAFQIAHSEKEVLRVDGFLAKELIDTELTLTEFADSLNMRPENEFVRRMFMLVDKNKNGFICFREFVDLLIIFADGTEEEKAKLLFNLYDIDGTGYLRSKDFTLIIKSFLETVGGQVDDREIEQSIMAMLKKAGVEHKSELSFSDFKLIIGDDIKTLNHARLDFQGLKLSNPNIFLYTAKETMENIYESRSEIESRFQGIAANHSSRIIDQKQEEEAVEYHEKEQSFYLSYRNRVLRFIEIKCREIFWLSLYTMVLLCIFAERAYYYSVEAEHSGLRRIAGYGVSITRGAASAIMFTHGFLFVTMCRNSITYLRDTVANRYFPFDSVVEIHKYIANWAAVFTVIHIVGHAFNFYHISTQTADDLTCLFRNYFHATHELPKFYYWCFQTITGVTGIALTMMFIIMYVFAQTVVRRKLYHYFWYSHKLYPIYTALIILHGSGRLIQAPLAYNFILAPLILFVTDSLVSTSRKKIEIPVLKAEVLPSNVTKLEIRKPDNFEFKAGQWVRISCTKLNSHEYHPFTLSSAPHEDTLTVHIRAVGPWTTNIRNLFDTDLHLEQSLSKVRLDGPYGEGHQDWRKYDVSVLIGGGIGVTPFASILKDVGFVGSKAKMSCRKVYFIWVSRTQKQFEWLVDIIRDVENSDLNNFISCHIFITQFYEKFDLRTILLYICEKHYQRISNKSLFTNLRAVTHFSRPAFPQFFKTVHFLHTSAKRIGVFSCGPPSMTTAVNKACSHVNSLYMEQRFEHHFKNF